MWLYYHVSDINTRSLNHSFFWEESFKCNRGFNTGNYNFKMHPYNSATKNNGCERSTAEIKHILSTVSARSTTKRVTAFWFIIDSNQDVGNENPAILHINHQSQNEWILGRRKTNRTRISESEDQGMNFEFSPAIGRVSTSGDEFWDETKILSLLLKC